MISFIFGFLLEKNYDNIFFNNIKYMIGYSIGEITALVCSNKISFENGLKIVYLRGYNMHLISNEINTCMITIKGLDIEEINKIYLKIYFYALI